MESENGSHVTLDVIWYGVCLGAENGLLGVDADQNFTGLRKAARRRSHAELTTSKWLPSRVIFAAGSSVPSQNDTATQTTLEGAVSALICSKVR